MRTLHSTKKANEVNKKNGGEWGRLRKEKSEYHVIVVPVKSK